MILLSSIVAYRREVLMGHSFLRRQPFLHCVSIFSLGFLKKTGYLVVISQQLVQEVYCLRTNEPLIIGVDEALPAFLRESAENVIVLLIQLDVIFVEVFKQIICAEDFRNLDKLI